MLRLLTCRTSSWTFTWVVLWYRAEFIVPLIVESKTSPNHHTIAVRFFVWNAAFGFHQKWLGSSVQETLFWNSWRSFKCFLANVRQAFVHWFLLFHESYFVPNIFLGAKDISSKLLDNNFLWEKPVGHYSEDFQTFSIWIIHAGFVTFSRQINPEQTQTFRRRCVSLADVMWAKYWIFWQNYIANLVNG